MSASQASPHPSVSTYDEDYERILQSSATPRRAPRQHLFPPDPSDEPCHPQSPYKEERDACLGLATAVEIITMERAVCVPHALRSATRRTMLDVLGHIRASQHILTQQNSSQQALSREDQTTLCDAVERTANDYPPKDLSRSLRHLLPPRRVGAVDLGALRQLAPDDVSISDFDDDDEEEEENKYKSKGKGKDHEEHHDKSNEEIERGGQMSSATHPASIAGGEEAKVFPVSRVWAKLFDLNNNDNDADDIAEGDTKSSTSRPSHNVHCEAHVGIRNSTDIPAQRESKGEEAEEALRSSTASGRRTVQSIATLLDAAEAQEDTDTHMRTSTDGTDVFPLCGQRPSAFFAAMAGARGTQRASAAAAMRQLAANATSARVIAYLTRSLDEWRFDARHFAAEAPEEGSGVQLRLRVKKVESAFSLYCIQSELVWAEPGARNVLYPTCMHSSEGIMTNATARERVEREKQEEDEDEEEEEREKGEGESDVWTVVLAAAVFHSIPIIVGEHMYLSRPFFCYPTVRTIVASLNVTCDATIRRLQEQHNERRQQRRRPQRTAQHMDALCDEVSGNGIDMCTPLPAQLRQRTIAEEATQREEHEHTPFKAYDPFVHPPAHLFRRNPTGRSLSFTPLRGQQQQQQRLSSSTPRKTMMHADVAPDAIGSHFPRGPGDEWDVPLEVLAAICPIQSNCAVGVTEEAVRAECDGGGLMDSGESLCTSLSSVELEEGGGTEPSRGAIDARRTDKVLFRD